MLKVLVLESNIYLFEDLERFLSWKTSIRRKIAIANSTPKVVVELYMSAQLICCMFSS